MIVPHCSRCQKPAPPACLFSRGTELLCMECLVRLVPALIPPGLRTDIDYCPRCDRSHVGPCPADKANGFTQWEEMGL